MINEALVIHRMAASPTMPLFQFQIAILMDGLMSVSFMQKSGRVEDLDEHTEYNQ